MQTRCRSIEDNSRASRLRFCCWISICQVQMARRCLKRLRSDQDPAVAQIPAIMLTGAWKRGERSLCLQAGADDFVTKPVNAAVLRARIETQLRLRSMRRQLERQNDELENMAPRSGARPGGGALNAAIADSAETAAAARLGSRGCYRPVIQVGGDIYGWLRMKDGRDFVLDRRWHRSRAAAALLTTLAKLLFHHGSMRARIASRHHGSGQQ